MKNWDVLKVRVEAAYIGRDPDWLDLTCRSMSLTERGEKIDGPVKQTVFKPDSLRANGIEIQPLKKITWKPNQVLFEDSRSGEKKGYKIRSVEIIEPDTAIFEVDHELKM